MKKNWNDINVADYYKIQELKNKNLDNNTLLIELLSILTGKDVKELNDIPFSELKSMIVDMNFLNEPMPKELPKSEYTIKGVLFKVDYSFSNITTGEFIDFGNCVVDNTPENIAIIMSIIFKPAKKVKSMFGKTKLEVVPYDKEELIEFLYNNLPYHIVNNVQVFFYEVLKQLFKTLKISLDIEMKKLQIKMNLYKIFKMKKKQRTLGVGLDVLIEYQKRLEELGMIYMK